MLPIRRAFRAACCSAHLPFFHPQPVYIFLWNFVQKHPSHPMRGPKISYRYTLPSIATPAGLTRMRSPP